MQNEEGNCSGDKNRSGSHQIQGGSTRYSRSQMTKFLRSCNSGETGVGRGAGASPHHRYLELVRAPAPSTAEVYQRVLTV